MASKKKTHKVKTTGKTNGKSNALGGGGRFAQVEAEAAASGARDPAAVAAAVGRKKYGGKKMAQMAAKGRQRAEEKGEGKKREGKKGDRN